MRRLIERHQQQLSSFLEQRRDLLLVVRATDSDAVLLLQLTSELDEASGEDLFVTLGGEFEDTDSYMLAAAEQFARQHALADSALRDAGKPPLLGLPPTLLAPGVPGRERLQALVAFAHQLLPREARRLVVVVAPTLIVDRTAYLALVAHLLPRPERERWMARLRVIARDVHPNEAPEESRHPLTGISSASFQIIAFDLSQDAIRQSLAESARDEASPPAARMQALLAASILDGVHGERERALQGLNQVLAYYQAEDNALMQAMTVNAMGEVCQTAGGLDQALHWFECALPLAVKCQNAFVLATVSRNLGVLSALRGDHTSAVAYFDALAQLSPKILDNETLSWALEQRGVSEVALGQREAAVASWKRGVELCRNTDHDAGRRAHLARLAELYEQRGQLAERELAQRELAQLPEQHQHA